MRIRNWKKFQHFRDRKPPWIKLYRDILDDKDWHALPPECAKFLVMLWLLASEAVGELPDIETIAFRLRIPQKHVSALLAGVSGWLEHDDIDLISERYQDDLPETETETETDLNPSLSFSQKTKKTKAYPDDFEQFWKWIIGNIGHKQGKKKVYQHVHKALEEDGITYDRLKGAYAAHKREHMRLYRGELGSVKQPAQFFGPSEYWRDWIDEANPIAEVDIDALVEQGKEKKRHERERISSQGLCNATAQAHIENNSREI